MTKTTTPKRKTTTRPANANRKGSTARAALPLEWDAVEYVPRQRWWVFVAIGWFAIPAAAMLLAYGNWSAALLAIVAAVTWFVVYLPTPKTWHYELNGSALTALRERHRGRADEVTLDLHDYRAVTTKVMRVRARAGGAEHFVLVPRQRFAMAKDIYPPSGPDQRRALQRALRRSISAKASN